MQGDGWGWWPDVGLKRGFGNSPLFLSTASSSAWLIWNNNSLRLLIQCLLHIRNCALPDSFQLINISTHCYCSHYTGEVSEARRGYVNFSKVTQLWMEPVLDPATLTPESELRATSEAGPEGLGSGTLLSFGGQERRPPTECCKHARTFIIHSFIPS